MTDLPFHFSNLLIMKAPITSYRNLEQFLFLPVSQVSSIIHSSLQNAKLKRIESRKYG